MRFLSEKTVQSVKEILKSPARREKMATLNYEVASRHYSYSLLRNHLRNMMNDFYIQPVQPLSSKLPDPNNVIYLNTDSSPAGTDSRYGHMTGLWPAKRQGVKIGIIYHKKVIGPYRPFTRYGFDNFWKCYAHCAKMNELGLRPQTASILTLHFAEHFV